MLQPLVDRPLSDLDRHIFDTLVPVDHYLRQVLRAVSFQGYHDLASVRYSPDHGRPALTPVQLFKFPFLQFQYDLSDRDVIRHARVNLAYRFFLGLGIDDPLPDPSLLSRFRSRLGPDLFQKILDDVLGQARAGGLVKDRLRLEDATHVIADVAVPSTLALVAPTRGRLLAAAEPFDKDWVAGQRAEALAIRTATADLENEERLPQRVAHLRSLVSWVGCLVETPGPASEGLETARRRLVEALGHARRLLGDHDDPVEGDRLASVADDEARWVKHGESFLGYVVDVSEDADSELITRIHVLPGNGDEGADTASLVREEEAAHGNDVEAVSQDGAGFRGDVLRELQDPEGLGLEVTVPPPAEPAPTGRFTPERFRLEVIDGQEMLASPEGEQTGTRERDTNDTGYKYRFADKKCEGCKPRGECVGPKTKGGRSDRERVREGVQGGAGARRDGEVQGGEEAAPARGEETGGDRASARGQACTLPGAVQGTRPVPGHRRGGQRQADGQVGRGGGGGGARRVGPGGLMRGPKGRAGGPTARKTASNHWRELNATWSYVTQDFLGTNK